MSAFFRFLILSSAVLALRPSAGIAGESAATCPEQIETEQSLRTAVAGFEARNEERPHFWSGITFYDGRPEQMASLKYDSEEDSGDGSYVQIWSFDPKTEYWLECRYDSTSISLVKKLPPVAECKVSVSAAQDMALACR
jgi:hypothetical protein